MNRFRLPLFAAMILGLVMLGSISPGVATAKEVSRISIDELKGVLDSKDYVILDVRSGKDWSSSELKIKGALREDPKMFDSWATKYPKDKKIVLYCA